MKPALKPGKHVIANGEGMVFVIWANGNPYGVSMGRLVSAEVEDIFWKGLIHFRGSPSDMISHSLLDAYGMEEPF
jgi:hypothetical protein